MIFMQRNLTLSFAGLALIAASLACGLGATPDTGAPQPTQAPAAGEPPASESTALPTMAEIAPTAQGLPLTPTIATQVQPLPAIPESRRLTLEFPPVMRTGDAARIRLQLEVDDRGNITPTAVIEGNETIGEVVEIPNLYETHNVIAEARLDMAGMEVQPAGTISEPLSQGQAVIFYWSVRPNESGNYAGTAWLHLRFIPKGGGEESRIPISAQFLEIEANSYLGFLSGNMARGIGALGSVIGSVLGFPFVEDLAKWFWRRLRGTSLKT